MSGERQQFYQEWIVEGIIVRRDANGTYDIDDPYFPSVQAVLEELFLAGRKVARVVITDPSEGYEP